MDKKIDKKWEKAVKVEEEEVLTRPSLTYWQDAWRRLRKNKLSILGLIVIILLIFTAIFGPVISKYNYSDENLNMGNLPSRLNVYQVSKNDFVYVHPEYRIYKITRNGHFIKLLNPKSVNYTTYEKDYKISGLNVVLDFKNARLAMKDPNIQKFQLLVNGKEIKPIDRVSNKTHWLGTDTHGRDTLIRVIYGARISLIVGFVASLVNFLIGVLYGGISGYLGGKVDAVMMRVMDTISTIPLLLYVILLMVIIAPGLKTIILAIGLTFWVNMARIVRGQALVIKQQEYVFAAKTLGASTTRILLKHIIPNAMGPIIVSLTMMIPSAIFTEAFLSFIGLGVSAPQASWGTLASDALGSIQTYPEQLLYPSLAISIAMLAFNFLGDGLRDSLDPRLRK